MEILNLSMLFRANIRNDVWPSPGAGCLIPTETFKRKRLHLLVIYFLKKMKKPLVPTKKKYCSRIQQWKFQVVKWQYLESNNHIHHPSAIPASHHWLLRVSPYTLLWWPCTSCHRDVSIPCEIDHDLHSANWSLSNSKYDDSHHCIAFPFSK